MRAALLLALALAIATPADSEDAVDGGSVFDEAFAFLEFHDPGDMVLRDSAGERSELSFGYEHIPYEVVATWREGRPLRIRYAPADGTELIDSVTGKRYAIPRAWPRIDALLDRCRAQAVSTAEVQDCDGDALAAWKTELDRAYDRLMASGLSEDTKTALYRSQGEWERFRDAWFAALRAYGSDGGGSIRRLETSAAALGVTKDRAGMLLAMDAPSPPENSRTKGRSEPGFPKAEDFPSLDAYESVEAFQAQIDRVEQQCRALRISSSPESRCGVEERLWDRELNAAYQGLMGVLSGGAKEALRRSQRSWITSRDETLAATRTELELHRDGGDRLGAPRSPGRTSALAEMTKARTVLLRGLKQDLEKPLRPPNAPRAERPH